MQGIEFLKDWDPKKHGWPAFIVMVIFVSIEVLSPKDKTCTQEVIYLQRQHEEDKITFEKKDSLNFELELQLLEAHKIIKNTDSAYRKKVINPAKAIIKRSKT